MYKNIYKYFRIAFETGFLILLLTVIGVADIPPPPVNQNLSTYDTVLNNYTASLCRSCHTTGVADVHNNTGYVCVDCHITNDYSLIDRNCLNCHNGSAFYANHNLTIGKPHHNTTYAQQRNCTVCHKPFVDNYNDGHYVPTYKISMDRSVCNTCHGRNLSATPPILTNINIHHITIALSGMLPQTTCIWCHPPNNGQPSINIRACELCHGVNSLHDIQYNYSETNGKLGYGHIGSNWDCKGCHVDSNHGDNCKDCHPYPIVIPLRTSTIQGTKFNDSNGDGTRDPGESGISGIRISLSQIISPGAEIDSGYTMTDANGNYTFINLSAGFYKVIETGLLGSSQTFPAAGAPQYINLGTDEVKTGIDFGNQQIPPGKIIGKKFNDTNGNGVQDIGEDGISGIKIILASSGMNTTTNSSGDYIFTNVPVGMQTVYEEFIPGYVATTPRSVFIQVNSSETSVVNFGNMKLIPPPADVYVPQQSGNQNGVPTVNRPGLTTLIIRKNLSGVSNVLGVNLTLRWNIDGTTKTANMVYNTITGVWETTFNSPFSPGTVRMTFNVDVAPAGPGNDDIIQIGDIMFVDPSGQIRSTCNNKPISGANVTLLVEFPPTIGNFIVSPPKYQLEPNPQTTLTDGFYGWMTIPGTYKVKVTSAGYGPNESEPVIVPPPRTGIDILLTPTDGCPYNFTGLFQPVENPPVLNRVNPGSAIPLKFSLDGYHGMNIFETGYPKSSVISCEGPIDTIGDNETVTTGESGLSYNQTTDQYKYVWKTDKKWNDCRQLVMKLNDGTYHRANFGFFS